MQAREQRRRRNPAGPSLVVLFLLLWFSAPGRGAGGARFTDVTAAAGVRFTHERATFDPRVAHIMTWMASINAGIAASDFDGDGDVDFYLLTSARDRPNALYRNDGAWRFVDVAAAAGAAWLNDEAGVSMDATFADADNDGDQDVFVAAYGRNRLLRNDGGSFREVGREAGVADGGNAAAALFLDYDGDGWLDLMVGNYYDDHDLWNLTTAKVLPTTFETARNGGRNLVYRNNGDGTFSEVGTALGMQDTGWTLDLGSADLDGDGDLDVYVANDFGYDVLYRNEGNGTFTEILEGAMGARDLDAGMNVDFGDYDADGDLDIYVTNITNRMLPQGNMLWRNEVSETWTFTDVAEQTGTADGGWGWAAKFFDFENDGDLDLWTVNGFVSSGPVDLFERGGQLFRGNVSDVRGWPDMRGLSLSGYQQSRLFENRGAYFADVATAAGVTSRADGRGIALADVDLDGRLDVFVSNCGAAPELYRNEAPEGGGWLEVELVGRRGNRDAVGGRAVVSAGGRRQLREVDGGNGFSGQSWRVLHFGLGAATGGATLELRWPGGARQRFEGVRPGSRMRIFE